MSAWKLPVLVKVRKLVWYCGDTSHISTTCQEEKRSLKNWPQTYTEDFSSSPHPHKKGSSYFSNNKPKDDCSGSMTTPFHEG